MPAPTSPTVRRRRLAAELRRLRDIADLTLEEVADRLEWSASKLSRIETAKSGAKIVDVRRLLQLYQVTGPQAEELFTLARDAEQKGWWEAYSDTFPEEVSALIGLEAEAIGAMQWQAQVVPGLLQTAAYAEQTVLGHQPALARPPGQVKAQMVARLQRQEVLTRDRPLALTAILDESILWRGYGGPQVMHEQLSKLLRVSEQSNVEVLVRPFASPQPPPTAPPFTYLDFGESFHSVVFVELLNGGVYVENDLDTYRYSLVLGYLREQALDETASRDMIRRIAREHWQI
jgi:transcriptional regulator with XRE-family HTH domain